MALLSKQDLCSLFNIKSNQLSVILKRATDKHKIDMDGERLDDSKPQNKVWIDYHKAKAVSKGVSKKEPAENHVINQDTPPLPDNKLGSLSFQQLNFKKLQEQVVNLERQNRKLQLHNEKTTGSFVSVEHCLFIVTNLSENINLAWENEMKEFILQISSRYQLSRDEITSYQREIIDRSNICKEKAIKESKKNIRKFQNEASDARGVGEHN